MGSAPPRNVLRFGVLFALGAIALWPASSSARPRSVHPATSRDFEFTYRVQVPALPQGSHELRLWVPLPRPDRHQVVTGLHIESPLPYRIRKSEYGNPTAYFTVDAAKVKTPFEINVTFHAVRREYRVDLPADPPAGVPARPASSEPAANAELARALQPDRMIPLDGIIGQLSQRETQGLTDPLEKARKIYEYVVAHMRYDKSGTGWGRGDAVWACDSHRGNCTDFHSLFIGMARAAGIPARFEIGFPLPEDQHEGEIPGYHCWAQFYLEGVGWVPVDASEAWKHPNRRTYYFGALDQNRILFTLGRDLVLEPAQAGDPLNYFVFPYAELDGKEFAGVGHKYSFQDRGPSAASTPVNKP